MVLRASLQEITIFFPEISFLAWLCASLAAVQINNRITIRDQTCSYRGSFGISFFYERTYIVEGLRGFEDQVPWQRRLRTIGIARRCRHIRYQIYGMLLEFFLPQGRVIPLTGLHPSLQIEAETSVNLIWIGKILQKYFLISFYFNNVFIYYIWYIWCIYNEQDY